MNIMKMATGALTPLLASKLAGAFGVPERMVGKVLSVGLPVILAAFMKRGASQEGAQAIGTAMDGLPSNPLSALGDVLGGDDGGAQSASKSGSDMLSSLLGGQQTSGLAEKLAGFVGGDKAAVSSLLGVAGAWALGTLKTAADEQGLDAAGVMKLLSSQKEDVAAAIPEDLARSLGDTGLLPDGLQGAAIAATSAAETQPGGGKMKWIIGIVVAALLVWLVPQFIGGGGDANPLVVDGTDIGETLSGSLSTLTETLAGVTDAGSAQSALETLTSSGASLSDLQSVVGGMGEEGKTAIAAIVAGALPALQTTIEGLLGNEEISAILKPVLDGIVGSLTSLAG